MSEYAKIRARNDSAWLIPNDGSRTNHRLRADMRRFARGGVLTQRLAQARWSVICPDAGQFWDPERDLLIPFVDRTERGRRSHAELTGHADE